MIIEYLNLEATDCADKLLNLTEERIHEISQQLTLAEAEMIENHQQYTAPGTQEDPGDGLHTGKVLGRIANIATTPQEEIAILLALHVVIANIIDGINERRLLEHIKREHANAKIIKL